MDATNRQFTVAGQCWTLSLTIGLARKIKSQCGVDLPVAWRDNWAGMQALLADAWAYLDVLWLTIEEQAKQRGVTREQLEEALDESAVEASAEALRWAIVGFIPAALRGELLAKVRLQKMAEQRITTKLDDPATQTAVDAAVDKVIGDRLANIGQLIPGASLSDTKPF